MYSLIVNIKEANNMKETEIVGKQDPYVEVKTNTDVKCTSVRQNAGKNASRKFSFYFTNSLERRVTSFLQRY